MFFIVASTNNLNAAAFSLVTPQQWLIFLLIVFTTGGAAIFLYYYGLNQVKASTSTIAELAFPLSAILLEFVIRGRVLSLSQWVGVIILFIAIYQVTLIQRELT